jgi:hypothetical protein
MAVGGAVGRPLDVAIDWAGPLARATRIDALSAWEPHHSPRTWALICVGTFLARPGSTWCGPTVWPICGPRLRPCVWPNCESGNITRWPMGNLVTIR